MGPARTTRRLLPAAEAYAYQDSTEREPADDLVSYTDPNGKTTTWSYYDISNGTDGR